MLREIILICFVIYGISCAIDYRAEMRQFVIEISNHGKSKKTGFIIIPQNGVSVMTTNGDTSDPVVTKLINSIDGWGQESLNYGYSADNIATPKEDTNTVNEFLKKALNYKKSVLVTDYCSSKTFVDRSYSINKNKGYISFAANDRQLRKIPSYPSQPYSVSKSNINNLSLAKNFLYIINSGLYSTRQSFLNALKKTNYDVFIMDAFYGNVIFTKTEIDSLKKKSNGGRRLVISYMSIGEAEDYRWYWESDWKVGNPSFLYQENPDWEGNYKVNYTDPEWKKIIISNKDSYLNKIINAGFDGVYLDIIDGFEFFEAL